VSFFEELKRRNVFRVGIAYAVAAWLLLQIADVLIDNIGAPDWVFPTLLMALAIGFPLALIFAWAFELTPEGIKRENDVDRDRSITRQTGRKLDRTIILVLALAVGYLLVDKLILTGDSPSTGTEPVAVDSPGQVDAASVAVLPFVNMSNDPDNEYFSDGLTDTLLHMLAQLPELRVAARTSSFAFKGQNKAIPEIASELGVANILEGSVQRAGEQVRVTAQLIRADDGFHVWSQNYTRPLEDIFAIQDEIATDVARALDASLLGGEETLQGVETSNLTAYDAYLRGREQEAIFTFASLSESELLYKRALTLDPDFVDARLALARNYLKQSETGIISQDDAVRAARPLVATVRESDPGNRDAEALECILNGRYNDGIRTREEVVQHVSACRALLALVPTDTFVRINVAGGLYYMLDDTESALDMLSAGLLIDPLSAELHNSRGQIFLLEERFEEAEADFLRAIELAPEHPSGYGRMAGLMRERNDLQGDLEWSHRLLEVDPDDHEPVFGIAWTLYGLDLPEEAERYYVRVQSMVPGSDAARNLELARSEARGDVDQVIRLAAAMIEDQVTTRRGIFWSSMFYYTKHMMEQGRAQEAYDFLVSIRPEITDFDALPNDWQGRIMQEFSIPLMTGFTDFETRRDAWRRYVAANEATGFDLYDYDVLKVWNEVIEGNIDQAVTLQVEEQMSAPVASALWRHKRSLTVFLADLYADPRYEAARSAREAEFLALRSEVQALLLEPGWSE
jgi:TolB-like protein/Tfp pilus assembly protein PilF